MGLPHQKPRQSRQAIPRFTNPQRDIWYIDLCLGVAREARGLHAPWPASEYGGKISVVPGSSPGRCIAVPRGECWLVLSYWSYCLLLGVLRGRGKILHSTHQSSWTLADMICRPCVQNLGLFPREVVPDQAKYRPAELAE